MHDAEIKHAAQYLRMSTEHQQYSLENQDAAIGRYAQTHGFSVVRTYSDSRRSGLVLKNRAGLRQLLEDVVNGSQQFQAILVYDVSRWGRFQDIDESAHYEFICRSAGISVHYCTEQFTNDTDVPNMIMKSLKRMMAGEYSRELSAKVFDGAKKLATLGFKQGGLPGYGYRRRLVSSAGEAKGQLLPGQRKSIQQDRVVLECGPEEEVYWVREIFRMFNKEGKGPLAIANVLNERGLKYDGVTRKGWYPQAVGRLLKNPKYAGHNVYGRSSQKLGSPRVKLPPSMWTVVHGCWPAIVDSATFESAQQRFANQTRFKSDEQLIAELNALLKQRGKLSEALVMEEMSLPSQGAYRGRFGSLTQAFALSGFKTPRLRGIEIRRRHRALRVRLLEQLVTSSRGYISVFQPNGHFRPAVFAGLVPLSVHVARCFATESGELRWLLNAVSAERDYLTLIARLDTRNDDFQDYFVLPNLTGRTRWTITAEDAGLKRGRRLLSTYEIEAAVHEMHLKTNAA